MEMRTDKQISSQTNRHQVRQTDIKPDKQISSQTNRHQVRQTDIKPDKQTSSQTETSSQTNRHQASRSFSLMLSPFDEESRSVVYDDPHNHNTVIPTEPSGRVMAVDSEKSSSPVMGRCQIYSVVVEVRSSECSSNSVIATRPTCKCSQQQTQPFDVRLHRLSSSSD